MTQSRLEYAMLIFVKQQLATKMDSEDIIEEFKPLNQIEL